MTEHQPVIGNAGGQGATRQHRFPADGNGEIGPERQVAPRRVGQSKGASADFLAGAVEENLRRLQHRRFLARIAARGEQIEQRHGLGIQRLHGGGLVIRKGNHQGLPLAGPLSIALISATNWLRATLFCASRLPTHSARLSTDLASSAPSAKTFRVTSPRPRSSPPSMTAMAAPRLSAYLSWSPILPLPT